ncbi:MAG: hypothetical protein ACYTG0_18905 [Planctomycetota bacterium]|jgi:hypothetical protein
MGDTATPDGQSAAGKLQEIIDRALDSGADSVTVEYAKEGGLEVCFMFGNTGIGDILVDRHLEGEVMSLICERAGLEERTSGVLRCASHGRDLDIEVEEYDSFGETAFTLRLPSSRD